MNASLSLDSLVVPLKNFLKRFHFVLFVLAVAGGLAVAIFMLNSLINDSQQEVPTSTKASFDTKTIERIERLRSKDESTGSQLQLPAGRTNPFIE